MSLSEDICFWSVNGNYFGLPIANIFRVGRASFEVGALGTEIDSAVIGNDLPQGSKVHVPNYLPPQVLQGMTDAGLSNVQFILLNQGSKYVAFMAERILFVGSAKNFTENHGEFTYLETEEYFQNEVNTSVSLENLEMISQASGETGNEQLRFKIKDQLFEVPLDQIVRLYSLKDLNQFQLLSDQAAGYIFDGTRTVPIISLSSHSQNASSRILTCKHGEAVIGIVVDEMLGIESSSGAESQKLSFDEVLQPGLVGELCHGYEKVFPSPKKILEQSQAKASAMSVIKVDVGETVFIPTELVISVQLSKENEIEASSSFTYGEAELPLVYLPEHYGFRGAVSNHKSHRVLIVERDGVRMALAVHAVLEVMQIDRESERQVLNWTLNNYSENFKTDATGIVNVADYRTGQFLNVIYLNFSTLFPSQQAG